MENNQEKSNKEVENEEALKWARFLYSAYKRRKGFGIHKEPDKA